ncbi:hypothetical protein ILUMI_18340 [Ignelater luminosus]|uniref:Uncharacterized protein n=1 Tax=Ignelater luminosus TaxID=2038154 RepID=A0A8K0G6Z9_IGNLU|nr:hypothetical protein ILUMI_18340 [Ignelater luminosus]
MDIGVYAVKGSMDKKYITKQAWNPNFGGWSMWESEPAGVVIMRPSCSINKPMSIVEDDVEQNKEKEDSDEDFVSSKNKIEESEEEYAPAGVNKVPMLFTQNDLNNLIRRYASKDIIKKEKKNFGNTTPKIRKRH